jgi:hypothetical protein
VKLLDFTQHLLIAFLFTLIGLKFGNYLEQKEESHGGVLCALVWA